MYINIHHIYTSTVHRNVSILNVCSCLPRQLFTKVTNFVLCCITCVWYPDEVPLRTETCWNIVYIRKKNVELQSKHNFNYV